MLKIYYICPANHLKQNFMKKVITIAAAALILASFASCKKDYTCTCKGTNLTTITYTLGKLTKKDATDVCDTWNTTVKIGDATASCELD
jgi:hypothetical protein